MLTRRFRLFITGILVAASGVLVAAVVVLALITSDALKRIDQNTEVIRQSSETNTRLLEDSERRAVEREQIINDAIKRIIAGIRAADAASAERSAGGA